MFGRGQEDVQVLGVHDEHQEREHDAERAEQAGEHRHGEEVLQEAQPRLGADERELEVALEERG
jgi:hypothetical protein